jgi:hypothetical protein
MRLRNVFFVPVDAIKGFNYPRTDKVLQPNDSENKSDAPPDWRIPMQQVSISDDEDHPVKRKQQEERTAYESH